jgi:hypothetical protein
MEFRAGISTIRTEGPKGGSLLDGNLRVAKLEIDKR